MEQEQHIRYLQAKKRVDDLKSFYSNLTAYCIVVPVLWWINLNTVDFLWAIFPTLGWGVGLIMHSMEAHGNHPIWGKAWEKRKLGEFMDDKEF